MASDETDTTLRPNPDSHSSSLKYDSVPGVPFFTPRTTPSSGTLLSADEFPQNKKAPKAFAPLKIRDYEFKNRIWASPMCQYSCESGTGIQTDWHVVNAGSFARGGAGLVIIEATAVLPNGPISPEDSGIWSDDHIAPLKRIVDFIHSQGGIAGIQLAHAGRKASTYAPWLTDGIVTPNHPPKPDDGIVPDSGHGFRSQVWGPSAIAYNDQHATPKAVTDEDIETLYKAYRDATIRANKAGFDVIEIHGAHGYLLHNFVSPVSNLRTDSYGGSLENRLRFPLRVTEIVRENFPKEKPLFYRISASDHHEKGEKGPDGKWISWGIEQSIELSRELKKRGVDLVDVSSAANYSGQKLDVKPGYQVPFARAIKQALPDLLVGAVGLITEGKQAEEILTDGKEAPDVIFAARQWLRDPHWALTVAGELGVAVASPVQYQRAYTRLYKEHA